MQNVTGIATDRIGNIYVASNQGALASVEEFSSGSLGNVAPLSALAGPNTLLSSPYGLDVDDSGNVFVANYASNSITEYAARSNGNVAPIAQVGPPVVAAPLDVKVDHLDRLFVTHGLQNGGPNGAVVLTSITAPSPVLNVPTSAGGVGIALASDGDVYLANNAGITRYIPPINGTSYSSIASASAAGALGVAVDTTGRVFTAAGGDFTTSMNGALLLEFVPGLISTVPTMTLHVAGWPVAVYPKP